jgi:hypothetical protein
MRFQDQDNGQSELHPDQIGRALGRLYLFMHHSQSSKPNRSETVLDPEKRKNVANVFMMKAIEGLAAGHEQGNRIQAQCAYIPAVLYFSAHNDSAYDQMTQMTNPGINMTPQASAMLRSWVTLKTAEVEHAFATLPYAGTIAETSLAIQRAHCGSPTSIDQVARYLLEIGLLANPGSSWNSLQPGFFETVGAAASAVRFMAGERSQSTGMECDGTFQINVLINAAEILKVEHNVDIPPENLIGELLFGSLVKKRL